MQIFCLTICWNGIPSIHQANALKHWGVYLTMRTTECHQYRRIKGLPATLIYTCFYFGNYISLPSWRNHRHLIPTPHGRNFKALSLVIVCSAGQMKWVELFERQYITGITGVQFYITIVSKIAFSFTDNSFQCCRQLC